MKYIKYYEAIHIPKFNIGDPVKLKNDPTNQFYIINGYDYREHIHIKDICRLLKYEYKDKLVNKEGMYLWYLEEELELIPEEELLAIKYNL